MAIILVMLNCPPAIHLQNQTNCRLLTFEHSKHCLSDYFLADQCRTQARYSFFFLEPSYYLASRPHSENDPRHELLTLDGAPLFL